MKPLNSSKQAPTEKINPRAMHKSYLDKMEDNLQKRGVVFFDETNLHINSEFLELPAEITEVPSRDLGEYLNAFTQQKVYLRTILGRVELELEEARRDYFTASAELYRKYSLDKLSETAKDRIINSHPDVSEAYYRYSDMRRNQDIVTHSISNVEDIIFMLSREVSRRTGDFSEENRAYNVNRR